MTVELVMDVSLQTLTHGLRAAVSEPLLGRHLVTLSFTKTKV